MKGLLESTDQQRLVEELVVPAAPVRPRRFAPARRRPHGRDGRFRGPRLRPAISPAFGIGPTRSAPADRPATRGCRTTSAPRWRLTDRGIAVVLVAGLMIAVAAVTVVTATALRVTSEHYQVSATLQP